MQKLKAKVALVTGGASGLGRAIAEYLAAEGARVVITDVQLSLGREAFAAFGGDFMVQDVTQESAWSQVMSDIQKKHGGLHVLVNNAGILGPMHANDPENSSLENWRKVFAVNVDGVFLGCRAAIPVIAASGGGSIINIASIAGLTATPYATAYGASKAAVRQMTKSVAQHCAERGLKIRCNSVHPGDVQFTTGEAMWGRHAAEIAERRGVAVETVIEEMQAGIPMGEFVKPQDVGAAVAFLASDEARHITGVKLVVDSGLIYCDTFRGKLTDK